MNDSQNDAANARIQELISEAQSLHAADHLCGHMGEASERDELRRVFQAHLIQRLRSAAALLQGLSDAGAK